MAGAWQVRDSRAGPTVVTNGLERPSEASWEDLVGAAMTVSLLSFAGHEVVAGEVKPNGEGNWSGKVLKAAAGAAEVRVGSLVEFSTAQVQTVTYGS